MVKAEVVPVDTHVHQIAMKHYGFRGGSKGVKGKVAMTPKLYEEVNAKLQSIWGPYAGWAHSVCPVSTETLIGVTNRQGAGTLHSRS